jgi:hypothetical protein
VKQNPVLWSWAQKVRATLGSVRGRKPATAPVETADTDA